MQKAFRLSEATHGLCFLKMVGDGDSSVIPTIKQAVPYGAYIDKIECANHAVKNYRSRSEELAKDIPEYRGKGGLTKRAIQRSTVVAQVAIKHSIDGDMKQLHQDLGLVLMCLVSTFPAILHSASISARILRYMYI